MRSNTHQWLVLWAARKMAADGYTIRGYDGPTPQGGIWNRLPLPPLLRDIRPDVFGARNGFLDVAYGEAKTVSDLVSGHTDRQFRVLAETVARCGARLYVSVPRSASCLLDKMLNKVGLLGSPAVVRLHVPDVLVSGEIRDCA